ncbi:MAG: archease [candidate division WOR-3 bacterium]
MTTEIPHHRPAYRLLDHTSDIKVEIYGHDLSELFTNAAFCLFDLMLDVGKVEPNREREVKLESPNLEELFLDWLRELLFLFSTESFAVRLAEVRVRYQGTESRVPSPGSIASGGWTLAAVLHGESYDPDRHGFKVEVKTPTYHEYKLEGPVSVSGIGNRSKPSAVSKECFRVTLVLDV